MTRNRTALEEIYNLMGSARDMDRYHMIRRGIEPRPTHPQDRTREFHEFYDAPIHEGPVTKDFGHMTDERVAFRVGFIIEELKELLSEGFGIGMEIVYHCPGSAHDDILGAIQATPASRDLVEVVDALGDLNVVVNGFALELGVDMNAVDREICASNFTKMGADGNPIIGDGITGPVGKVLKGPNYMKPNIAAVLGLTCEDEGCPHAGTQHSHVGD